MTVTPLDYDIRLGPLAFTWPSDTVTETLGDALEAVGAALTPAERRPRPLKLALRVEGRNELDNKAAGYRLRRQVRQMLENPHWRQQGLYFWWRADPEMSGWILLGGGELEETDPGVSFGIWALSLESPYLVGRPATHRMGRRLDLADRRTGLVALDTRGTLYSTDFSAEDIPAKPLILPGDIASLVKSANRGIGAGTVTASAVRAGRKLWQSIPAIDGDVISYVPDVAVLTDELEAPVLLDEPGAVRVWDLSAATTLPPTQATYSTAGDADPTLYGWERVYGSALRRSTAPLAIDNGLVRVLWESVNKGLAFEWYDTAYAGGARFRREGYLTQLPIGGPTTTTGEASVVELTPERAVLEFRLSDSPGAVRVILQRGWNHARLEVYAPTGLTAQLVYDSAVGTIAVADGAPTSVKTITAAGRIVYVGKGTVDTVNGAVGAGFAGANTRVTFSRTSTLVAQVGSPASSAADVASWGRVDARSVPVLLRRAAA
jgi:hypothetical protein